MEVALEGKYVGQLIVLDEIFSIIGLSHVFTFTLVVDCNSLSIINYFHIICVLFRMDWFTIFEEEEVWSIVVNKCSPLRRSRRPMFPAFPDSSPFEGISNFHRWTDASRVRWQKLVTYDMLLGQVHRWIMKPCYQISFYLLCMGFENYPLRAAGGGHSIC